MNKLIYDDKCIVCTFITKGLKWFNYRNLKFVAASKLSSGGGKTKLSQAALLGNLHYISSSGELKKDAEACVYVLSNIKRLGFIKYLYIRPISYLFDLAYYILKQFRVFVYKLNKKYPHLFN